MNCCFTMETGETMHSYCIKHGYTYRVVWDIADKYGYTPEQAIDYYINKRKPYKARYFYKGQKLYSYCAKKPKGRAIFSLLLWYIKKKNMTVEQAIAHYNNKQKGKGNELLL